MEKLNTDFILSNATADSITQWLDKGIVRSGDFPPEMRYAVDAQNKIGYMNLFCGKLSIHWLELFDKQTPETGGKHQDSSLWGALILEVIIQQYIKLWETRNKGTHDTKLETTFWLRAFTLMKLNVCMFLNTRFVLKTNSYLSTIYQNFSRNQHHMHL